MLHVYFDCGYKERDVTISKSETITSTLSSLTPRERRGGRVNGSATLKRKSSPLKFFLLFKALKR